MPGVKKKKKNGGGHTTEIRKTTRPLQPRTLDSRISKLSTAYKFRQLGGAAGLSQSNSGFETIPAG